MSDVVARGKRLVLRYAALQLACAGLVALGFGLGAGLAQAGSALAGGAIAAAGTTLFGWRLFRPGIAPAPKVSAALWAGEALKWLWTGVALWLALAYAGLPPLPLLCGLIVAQVGFWLGVAVIR